MRDAGKESESDALGAFYVIGEKPNEVISGWIALEDDKDELLETIFEEMEYTLQIEIKDQQMYDLFFVDSKKNNSLIKVPDQIAFEQIKKQDPIMIMVLHKSVNKSEVEQHPRFRDWLDENS